MFDRTVADLHNAVVDAGFEVWRLLESGSSDPEDYDEDPPESNRPELMAKVPRSLRFWAVVDCQCLSYVLVPWRGGFGMC